MRRRRIDAKVLGRHEQYVVVDVVVERRIAQLALQAQVAHHGALLLGLVLGQVEGLVGAEQVLFVLLVVLGERVRAQVGGRRHFDRVEVGRRLGDLHATHARQAGRVAEVAPHVRTE